MKGSSSIQLKAALLLIVFSLNTVVGFACSVGLDMKFNESHHGAEKAARSHPHADSHQSKESAPKPHKHDSSHSHEEAIANHQQAESPKDDCCTDEAIEFSQIDKRAPKTFDFSFQPVFFDLPFTSFFSFVVNASDRLVSQSKYFVRTHHPPIPEIRIAIQSFQI